MIFSLMTLKTREAALAYAEAMNTSGGDVTVEAVIEYKDKFAVLLEEPERDGPDPDPDKRNGTVRAVDMKGWKITNRRDVRCPRGRFK